MEEIVRIFTLKVKEFGGDPRVRSGLRKFARRLKKVKTAKEFADFLNSGRIPKSKLQKRVVKKSESSRKKIRRNERNQLE